MARAGTTITTLTRTTTRLTSSGGFSTTLLPCSLTFFALLGQVTLRRRARVLKEGDEVKIEDLPVYTMKDLVACAKQAAGLTVIDGLVYDLTEFEPLHPGGDKILRAYYGKDSTNAFRGKVHKHTPAANNLMKQYCVGRFVVAE
eukprot:Rmarinus@m.26033